MSKPNYRVVENDKGAVDQDRKPNFRDDKGRLYLVRCFACEPERGRENWAMAVSEGRCAFCGWKDGDE